MQAFELTVQAAYRIFNLAAAVLSAFAVRKRISLSEDSDQMAPPFGNLPPLKRWTKLFTLTLFVRTFLFANKNELLHLVQQLIVFYSSVLFSSASAGVSVSAGASVSVSFAGSAAGSAFLMSLRQSSWSFISLSKLSPSIFSYSSR